MTEEYGSSHNYLYKLCFLGKMSVGKSCLCTRFAGMQFPFEKKSTIGATFMTSKARVADGIVKLEIWDTAGQERFKALAPMYYRGAQGVFVVYDISSKDSFIEAQEYIQTVRSKVENPDSVTIVLLGNKQDLIATADPNSIVPRKDVQKWAEENKVLFFEVSAQTGYNTAAAIRGLLTGESLWENEDEGAPTWEKALGTEEGEKKGEDVTPPPGMKDPKMIWCFEEVKPSECKAGLLGRQLEAGQQPRFDGMSYRSYASGPILELVDSESNVELQYEKKSGCCGK